MHLRKVMKHFISTGCLLYLQYIITISILGEGTKNVAFLSNWRVNLSGKWHGETHKCLSDSIRSTSHLPYSSKESYETLHNQCMPLIVVHYLSFAILWKRVSKIWYFVCNLRINLSGKYQHEVHKW